MCHRDNQLMTVPQDVLLALCSHGSFAEIVMLNVQLSLASLVLSQEAHQTTVTLSSVIMHASQEAQPDLHNNNMHRYQTLSHL